MIRDRIVLGVDEVSIQERLLRTELSKAQAKNLHGEKAIIEVLEKNQPKPKGKQNRTRTDQEIQM